MLHCAPLNTSTVIVFTLKIHILLYSEEFGIRVMHKRESMLETKQASLISLCLRRAQPNILSHVLYYLPDYFLPFNSKIVSGSLKIS